MLFRFRAGDKTNSVKKLIVIDFQKPKQKIFIIHFISMNSAISLHLMELKYIIQDILNYGLFFRKNNKYKIYLFIPFF